MIFYIIAALHVSLFLFGTVLTWLYRYEPAISVRGIYQTLFCNTSVTIFTVLLCISLEDYYYGSREAYDKYCHWFQGLIFGACPSFIGWPFIFKCFETQFRYFSSQSKFENYDADNFYFRYRFLLDPKVSNCLFFTLFVLFLIPNFVIASIQPTYDHPNAGIVCIYPYQFVWFSETLFLFLLFSYLFCKFLQFKDPFGIKIEFWSNLAQSLFTVAPFAIVSVGGMVKNPNWIGDFQPGIFMLCTFVSFVPFNLFLPLYLAIVENKRLKKRSGSQPNLDSIKTILESPLLLEYFKDIVAQHWCTEALLFALEIEEYMKESDENIQKRAEVIVQDFIRPNSKFEINIPQAEVREITKVVASGQADKRTFLTAAKDVHEQLYGIMLRWRVSETHTQALQEFAKQLEKDRHSYLVLKPLQV